MMTIDQEYRLVNSSQICSQPEVSLITTTPTGRTRQKKQLFCDVCGDAVNFVFLNIFRLFCRLWDVTTEFYVVMGYVLVQLNSFNYIILVQRIFS
jgi:hypothetical protein